MNTLVMLSGAILERCDVFVHIVTGDTGKVPPRADAEELLRTLDRPRFEARFRFLFEPDAIWTRLTYTQWEVWLAKFHHNSPCLCFHLAGPPSGGEPAGRNAVPLPLTEHVELVKAHAGYFVPVDTWEALLIRLLQYLYLKATTGSYTGWKDSELYTRFGPGAVDRLKTILEAAPAGFLRDGFLLRAYVHIAEALPRKVAEDRTGDLALVNTLTEYPKPNRLLLLAMSCRDHAAEGSPARAELGTRATRTTRRGRR